MRLFLEDKDAIQAEVFLNRASSILPPERASDEFAIKEARLAYRLCQARILDFKRRFLDASWKYQSLSYATELDEQDRFQSLYVFGFNI